MSHIYNYSKELVPLTQDPKERAAAIRTRRGAAKPFGIERAKPRIKTLPSRKLDVTIPLSYVITSRIREWLKK